MKTSWRIRKILMVLVLALLVLAALLTGFWSYSKKQAARERAEWKGPALEKLARLTPTSEEVLRELDQLRSDPTPQLDFGWTHSNVLLMTNGEHIVYSFRHGANNGFVDHLFLGRGSDGRWLYSTYHFCSSMAGVRGETQPGSIDEFIAKFALREFDGHSDECLEHTWPKSDGGE
jgi:hypothetical protein